jgi:hypothetical protein
MVNQSVDEAGQGTTGETLMKKLFVTCATLALGLYGFGAAFAQYTPATGAATSQGQPGSNPGQTMSPPTEQQLPPTTEAPHQSSSPSQGQTTAADLTGQLIYSSTGHKIGSVSSMTTDAQGQQEAVVSVGRYLGMGGKNVLMPVSSLQARSKGGYETTLSSSEIKKLPEYKGGGAQQ